MASEEAAFVSRETLDRLRSFADFVVHVGRRINLVAGADGGQVWERHVADSLQLLHLAPEGWRRWADLGSGGGFPGMVIAIAAQAGAGSREVILIESDQRKAAFLEEAAARFAPGTRVIAGRIESVSPQEADVVSARALAPLPRLFGYVARHLQAGGVALLPKGRNVDEEILDARQDWAFREERLESRIDPESCVLRIHALERR